MHICFIHIFITFCAFSLNKMALLTARIDCVENFQIIDAQQAKLTDNYRNTKYKLFKTNAGDKYMYLTFYVGLVGIK